MSDETLRGRTCALAAWALLAATGAAAQVRPASVGRVTPPGVQQGSTITLSLEGTNLADARAVLFDDPALTGRIVTNEDLGPDVPERDPESTGAPIQDRARKCRLKLEVTVGAKAPLGRHSFRLLTPLGTTNAATLIVGRLPEVAEAEPNGPPGGPQALTLPATVNGVLDKEDLDRYRFEARAGQRLVFEATASRIGSTLDPVLRLMDASGHELARSSGSARPDAMLAHTFAADGSFVVEVSDALHGGGPGYVYRLTAGELPYLARVFPLGVRRGAAGTVQAYGDNLGEASASVDLAGLAPGKSNARVRVTSPRGEPLNSIDVAVGDDPETQEREPNDLAHAQPIAPPLTVNGRIEGAAGRDEDVFRFHATRGQTLVFTVVAARLGSPLDSVLEVLDARGHSVPRATLRPVWQTTIDLRDHDSMGSGMRLVSWSGIRPGDFLYVDRELVRVDELPAHPDADVAFVSFRGRRRAFEETTPEGHALSTPVYKVEVHRPGATFPDNGMSLVTLYYRNDDGGGSYGKDSHLTFLAPATGEYFLRLRDSRGLSGPDFAYRLTVAGPRPDFKLSVGTSAPNVPRGSRVPVNVAVERYDGFDGAVEVEVVGLPAGLQATAGTVRPGSSSVVLTLSAEEAARLADPVPFKVVGRARIGGRLVEHDNADAMLSLASVVSPPDLYMAAVEPRQLEVEPGGRVKVSVRIRRANGFAGRVPVSVQNVPFGVHIPDVGLNGVLITEKEESRDFYLIADPEAAPLEQTLFLTGRVETNSSLPTDQASESILLKIVPKRTAASR
jgi:hypothetical protein